MYEYRDYEATSESGFLHDDIITIKWDNGTLRLLVPEFFPCSQKRLRLFLKTTDLDWRHKREIQTYVKDYYQGLIEAETATVNAMYNPNREEVNRIAKRVVRLKKQVEIIEKWQQSKI